MAMMYHDTVCELVHAIRNFYKSPVGGTGTVEVKSSMWVGLHLDRYVPFGPNGRVIKLGEVCKMVLHPHITINIL